LVFVWVGVLACPVKWAVSDRLAATTSHIQESKKASACFKVAIVFI
jgi:hypothetical protein